VTIFTRAVEVRDIPFQDIRGGKPVEQQNDSRVEVFGKLIITQEDLKNARERRRKYGRKLNLVTFPPNFVDRVEEARKKADDLLERLEQAKNQGKRIYLVY
jgi:hypothetical protein